MPEAIWSAVIVAAGSIIVQILINHNNRAKEHEEQAVYRARLEGQLSNIGKKLDEHNMYAEKIGGLRDAMIRMQQDVEYLKEGKL